MEEEKSTLEETLEEVAVSEEGSEQEQEQEVVENQPKETASNANSENIRFLREEKERLQKERDDYQRRLWEYERQQQQQAVQAKPQDNYKQPAPDDLVEYKDVQRLLKERDEENKRYRAQAEAATTEARLRSKFTDFDSVVSPENISMLNSMEPELAESIGSNPNMYNKAIAAYKAIKRLAPKDTYTEEKDRVVRNVAKPRPSNAASPKGSDSPLSKANAFGRGLSDEQKKAIYQEMQDILN